MNVLLPIYETYAWLTGWQIAKIGERKLNYHVSPDGVIVEDSVRLIHRNNPQRAAFVYNKHLTDDGPKAEVDIYDYDDPEKPRHSVDDTVPNLGKYLARNGFPRKGLKAALLVALSKL